MKLRVSCVQFRSHLGEIEHNLSQMGEWCERAASQDSQIVVFPEACLTGYCRPREMIELAQPFDGELRERIAQLAIDCRLLVAFGMPERDGGNCYNTIIAVGTDGTVLGHYRKTHLWAAEEKWATPGDALVAFDFQHVRFGMMLCYDTRFPEVARSLALQGCQVLLVSSAWRSSHAHEWRFCVRARALDNGVFVAGSDALLEAEHFRCAGASIIAGPDGSVVTESDLQTDSMITAELDFDWLNQRRDDLPLLRQRRPALYGQVTNATLH